LKELGEDPVTKRNVVVRTGRFGLYVTDGEVNATLRLGDTPRPSPSIAPASYSPNGATPNRRVVPQSGQEGNEEAREEGDQEITCEKRRPEPPSGRR